MTAEDDFIDSILRRLAEEALPLARAACPSMTLKASMKIVKVSRERIEIQVPEYWSLYYHDGRAGFGPKGGVWLVYWRDARQDPRLHGGFPVRATDIVRLTKSQWDAALDANRIARQSGLVEPVVIVKQVGPAVGHPFFEIGLRNFIERARAIVAEMLPEWIQREVFRSYSDTASGSL